ncbi:FecR domain-containing protein [Chitinophagales bacterium]|nr:FecR domain-containing protein [Chitinophagales bacterium]
MSIEERHNYYHDLSIKYLSGDCSASDQEKLENWVIADSKNKQAFMEFKQAWVLAGVREDDMKRKEVEEQWTKFAKQNFETGKMISISTSSSRRKWLSIAASLLLIVGASYFLSQSLTSNDTFYATAKSEKKTIELTDGSTVTLNSGSAIEFTEADASGNRLLKLRGDAFFDITRNEKSPFLIAMNELEIEVLGTSFYVDGRKEKTTIEVIVESGKVAVRSSIDSTILVKNEKAVVKKATKKIAKSQNTDSNFNSIKTNKLHFTDAPLSEVIFALNRQFGSNIILESNGLDNCRLFSTFNNDQGLDNIVTIIENTLGIKSVKVNDQILLTGSCSDNGN